MDRRSNVAQVETVAHGNGYFGDGFSRPFSNGGCPEDGAVVARDDLDQSEPVVFVHSAVDLVDLEGSDLQVVAFESFSRDPVRKPDLLLARYCMETVF